VSTATETQGRDTERRFFERLPQNSVMRVVDPKKPDTDQFAILKDISRSGARLEVERQFQPDVVITLYLPKTQFGAPRKIKARITWCTVSNETPGWYQIGCQFSR
jgi:hypothetical protein